MKNRGVLRITQENFAKMLDIQGEVANVTYDPEREIISIFVSANEETKHALPTREGSNISTVLP